MEYFIETSGRGALPLFAALLLGGFLLSVFAGMAGFRSLQETKGEIEKQRQEISGELEELREAKKEIEQLKSENGDEVESGTRQSGSGLSAVIQEWRPRTAFITCDWTVDEEVVFSKNGSGVAFSGQATKVFVSTNKHVISDEDFGEADYCTVKFPDVSSVFAAESILSFGSSLDFAAIELHLPHHTVARMESSGKRDYCKDGVSIGDTVIVLGYPTIGSETDITVTEGIISGFEEEYFITSAKVDEGNSGGAAILVKDSCYLGIPTYVKRGGFESLARILDRREITPMFQVLQGE